MATILPFAVRPTATRPGRTGDAAIIIFPGVRYEAAEKDGGRRDQPGQGGKCQGAEARGSD